jgi:hypothetical protein
MYNKQVLWHTDIFFHYFSTTLKAMGEFLLGAVVVQQAKLSFCMPGQTEAHKPTDPLHETVF